MEIIQFTNEEEIKEFYETFGSKHLKMQSEILKEFGIKQIDIYFKSIGFVTTVISIIGIVAGFGFTAFEYIQSLPLFFVGEGLLFGMLFYGLFWVQKIYQGEYKTLNDTRKKYSDFFEERNKKFIELYNNALNTHSMEKGKFIELHEIDQQSIDLFKVDDKEILQQIYSKPMYYLALIGAIFLFSSFFIIDLLNFITCHFYPTNP